MSEEEKEVKKEIKLRQIIIETDGNDIKIVKAEVAGNLEMIAIFSSLLNQLNK